jgi:diacylglycerol kinase (ATP)
VPSPDPPVSSFKSRSGWRRLIKASTYSWQGLRAAWRHEAAFRQELLLAVPAAAVAVAFAPGRWQLLALLGSLGLLLVVELLNSALEAVADAVTLEHRELLGRAKDLGSAAVLLTLLLTVLTWAVVFWP